MMEIQNIEQIIQKHIMDILIKCKAFDTIDNSQAKDFQHNLSYCLWLVRKYINKIEERFLYHKENVRDFSRQYSAQPTKEQNIIAKQPDTNVTITINQHNICYTKIPNQEQAFIDFLHQNINFRSTNKFSRERSVDSYISRLNSLSREISRYYSMDFHFLCFMGDNADIDFMYSIAIKIATELNIFSNKFIIDSNSAIWHYKNFNMQILHKNLAQQP